MSIDNHLFPFAGNNAIQNVVFALEWADQLQTSELHAIRALHDDPKNTAFRKALPQVQEARMVTINVGGDLSGQPVKSNAAELGGVNFSRPSQLGAVSRALNVSRGNCLGVVTEYTRWAQIWPEVRDWLLLITPIIQSKRAVTTIGLQYTDVFQWKADPASLVVSEVLSTDSKYLAKNIFQAKSIWHSHHGYVEKCTTPVPSDLLENVNVNMLENNGQKSIQIVTSHRATLATPVWGDMRSLLEDFMTDLHVKNKAIMKNLLTPPVQSLIKLSS